MFNNDERIVLTLDAGGTNFVFTAIQGNKEIVAPITLPSNSHDLDKCLDTLLEGFTNIRQKVNGDPVAVSFAFPGPADYENGIIGDLPNFPSFRGGVALGPFLQEKLQLPVFINNDGNLFAYGEALAGALPGINKELEAAGSTKQYKNLLAVTLGTGFGGGVVINNVLLTGDNGTGGDVWCSAYKYDFNFIAEEGASIRAIKSKYNEFAGEQHTGLEPKDIFDIAEGVKEGNKDAAIKSFEELGRIAGFTIAESLNIVDGIVVVGGGIAKAYKYILPAMAAEMNAQRGTFKGDRFSRLQMKVYNLMDENNKAEFLKDESKDVMVPGTERTIKYNTGKKTGVTVSALGTSEAVSLGAYAFALTQLDDK